MSFVVARSKVVILLTNDQRTLDANCYGSRELTTLNIDRLAATGVRPAQAYAHPVRCPVRAASLDRAASSAGSNYRTLHFAWGNMWAVCEGNWNLIGNTRNATISLHGLATDKPEIKNYGKENPELVERLRSLHAAWAKEVKMKW